MFSAVKTFCLAKDVRRPNEYEDACAINQRDGVAAVADGVSSMLFSSTWARLLAETAVTNPPDIFDAKSLWVWLGALRNAWSEQVDEDALAWHQKPKLADGAGATLLVATVVPMPSGYQLYAYAVGDCCLFLFRDGKLARTFPITEAAEFQNSPRVITSVAGPHDGQLSFDTLGEVLAPGDELLLTSDAFAAWMMAGAEAGKSIDLAYLWDSDDEQFAAFVTKMREEKRMRFDDCTVVLLKLAPVESRSRVPVPPEPPKTAAPKPAAEATDVEPAEPLPQITPTQPARPAAPAKGKGGKKDNAKDTTGDRISRWTEKFGKQLGEATDAGISRLKKWTSKKK